MRTVKRSSPAMAVLVAAACLLVNSAQPAMPKAAPAFDRLMTQSKQQLDSGDYSSARLSLEEALKLSRTFPSEDPRLGTLYHCLGNLYLKEQDYATAGDYFQRAITIEQKKFGPDSLEVGDALFGLANCYQQGNNPMMAEVYIKRVVEIWSKAYGPDSEKLLSVLPSLATYASLNSNYKLAEETHRRILRIKEKTYGASDPRVGTSLNTLASLAATDGKYEEAKKLAERATEVLAKTAGSSAAYDAAVTNLQFVKQQLGETQPAASQQPPAPPGPPPAKTEKAPAGKSDGSTSGSSGPHARTDKPVQPSTTDTDAQSTGVTTGTLVRAPGSSAVATTPDEFRPWELKNQSRQASSDKQQDRTTSWGKIRYLAGGRLISQEEYKAMLLANEAYELIKEEKYRMAADVLRKAATMCPTLASVRTNLGLALSRLGDNDQAIEEFKQSIALEPTRPAAWLNLASCFQVNGQLKESVATYNEYLYRFPGDSLAAKARDLVTHLQKEVDNQTAVERALASSAAGARP
ncbi:MAG TPA: tetratricopeptide repeat protein, partial [Candidatus Obscuribacterales bacterium]